MSESLFVVVARAALGMEHEAAVQRLFMMTVSCSVSPATASTMRLAFRHGPVEMTIEPFVATASFQALLGVRRKRAQTMTLLSLLVESAFHVATSVGVVLRDERSQTPRREMRIPLEKFRTLERIEKGIVYDTVATARISRLPQVEAKLRVPKVVGNDKATRYYRSYTVRAASPERAMDYVRMAVEDDDATAVVLGDLLDEGLDETSGLHGVVSSSGRIFFSDPQDL